MSLFELKEELRIGHIVEVSGTSLKIEVDGRVTDLTRIHDGRVYPIGQIGGIVKIHFGRRLIFGFVTLLRMRSEEIQEARGPVQIPPEADQRMMEVVLFAEGVWGEPGGLKFARGIATYPLPFQGVFLLTREEAKSLYEAAESAQVSDEEDYDPLVPLGQYLGGEGAVCRANIDKMFGTHCAILGSTGSGKSGALAALIHGILEHRPSEGCVSRPRIVIIDPHGEYGQAFGNRARVYRAYDPIGTSESSADAIHLPYWLMSADEIRMLVIGKTEREATSQNNVVYKAVAHSRMVAAELVEPAPSQYGVDISGDSLGVDAARPREGVSMEDIISFDRDKPRPFRWGEFCNHIQFLQAARLKNGKTESVPPGEFAKGFRPVIDKLSVLRLDPRIDFFMREWSEAGPSLATVISQLVGELQGPGNENERDLRVLDISGLPNEVAGPLSAMLARLLFQYKMYQTLEERRRDPIVLVCEEAHRYVPDRGEAEYAAAQDSIRRIAREGRKYGIGLLLVSQRPADIESTVISQCSTWLVLRLTNSADQQHVARFLPDGLQGMTRILPNLAQQEAIFVGEGASVPARIRIRDLSAEKLPRSETARFAGGWVASRPTHGEIEIVANRMAS